MNMFSLKVYRIITIMTIAFLSFSYGADLKIVHMDGVFDLDNDDLVEFITIEEGKGDGGVTGKVGYYEIDELGYPQLLWHLSSRSTPSKPGAGGRFQITGALVDAAITDLNGSGTAELVIAANVFSPNEMETGTIFVFQWTQGEFPDQPTLTLSLGDPTNPHTVNNLILLDLEGDGMDELAVGLQGQQSTISVFGLKTEENTSYLREVWNNPLSEFRRTYAGTFDYNRDGQSDLIAFSPDGNILRLQAFLNQGGQLTPASSILHRVTGMSEALHRSMVTLDWDGDSRDDLLVPFRSGHVVKLSVVDKKINVLDLAIDGGPLSDLKTADLNQDHFPDLVLVSGQQGLITTAYGGAGGGPPLQEFFSVASEDGGTQIFSVVAEIVDGIYLGTVIAGGWTGEATEIFYFELGGVPEYPEEILVDTYVPETTIPEAKVEQPVIEPQPSIPMEGIPLPPGILPTYILPVNQSFAYTVPEDEDREFFSFRWVETPPRGMYFHYDTRSIEWVPDQSQLGAYELEFLLKMKVGESVEIVTSPEDSSVTYQVIPELATFESRFWIYVNDPPTIFSEPKETEFVAGSEFVYQLEAHDTNEDAHLRYSLEKAPAGMTLDNNGLLFWQTDDSHVDIYDVRIVVSDGFDRDVQSLKLYSRGQVVITSAPETEAATEERYEYQVDVQIPEDKAGELKYTLVQAPYGMMVDNTGLITWEPQVTQIDTQQFVIVANHGIAADSQHVALFVNHPPVIVTTPDPMTLVSLGDTLEFQFMVEDPNEFDIVRYEPISMPEGMRIDPSTGRLVWVPTEENLDFSTADIEITDGRVVIEQSFKYFVNATIQITSEPPVLGAVGKTFSYPIKTNDLNRGSLMTFDHITSVHDVENTKIYSVVIEDEVFSENIERYIGDFKAKKSILIEIDEKGADGEEVVARLNLKRFVEDIFFEDGQLTLISKRIGGRWIKVKDILWHFFEGNKGKPPKVNVERVPLVRYTLLDFPDGMFIDEIKGAITWTPSTKQYDAHTVTFMVSDGYTKDEQSFDLYINHPPTIISTPPKLARVDQLYKYQVVVEDKNSDKKLNYELLKAPKGMQITRDGRISWVPTPTQINSRLFSVKITDGYTKDIQETNIFVNMPPAVISKPKPVALTNFEYRYRFTVEDLNGDKVKLRPIKLPKGARFDEKTGVLKWKPHMNQQGVNDIVLSAVDERGAATSHEFEVHVFQDPSAQQFVSTSWPILLAFVGAMFAVGAMQ